MIGLHNAYANIIVNPLWLGVVEWVFFKHQRVFNTYRSHYTLLKMA